MLEGNGLPPIQRASLPFVSFFLKKGADGYMLCSFAHSAAREVDKFSYWTIQIEVAT